MELHLVSIASLHTYTHTIYIVCVYYIYIYILCVCVCVCICVCKLAIETKCNSTTACHYRQPLTGTSDVKTPIYICTG